MKLILSVLIVFFNVTTYAQTTAGDYAKYYMDHSGIQYQLLNEVVSVNPAKGKYVSRMSAYFNNVLKDSYEVSSLLRDKKEEESWFFQCLYLPARLKPQMVTVTVPAGTFAACYSVGDDQGTITEIYFGDVPFGILKMVVSNKNHPEENYNQELSSFLKN